MTLLWGSKETREELEKEMTGASAAEYTNINP